MSTPGDHQATGRLPGLAALEAAIEGSVVSPDYELLRKPAWAQFADVRPQAVVRCATPADVAETIRFARRVGAGVAARSGGHCFAGRSSTRGILIDLSPMSSVSVANGIVTVGAGALLGAIYERLDEHGLTLAAGACPSVGIAGLTLGGRLGILGRRYGLTCDQLVATQVVLADGRIVDCNERREPELFWALRGAGGGQFGIVTRLVSEPFQPTTSPASSWPGRTGRQRPRSSSGKSRRPTRRTTSPQASSSTRPAISQSQSPHSLVRCSVPSPRPPTRWIG